MEQTNIDKSKKRKREEHITFIDELIEESINNKKNKQLLESTENELELVSKKLELVSKELESTIIESDLTEKLFFEEFDISSELQTKNSLLEKENELAKIDAAWRNNALVVIKYKKDGIDRGFVLRAADDLKLELEDNMLNLQAISSSRYVTIFIERVRRWEKTLNIV
jgi:superfamily II RNA helicase